MLFPNGDKYEGYFENDKFHGKGVLTDAQGTETNGFWKEGNIVI